MKQLMRVIGKIKYLIYKELDEKRGEHHMRCNLCGNIMNEEEIEQHGWYCTKCEMKQSKQWEKC